MTTSVIVCAVRTPGGKRKRKLRNWHAADLASPKLSRRWPSATNSRFDTLRFRRHDWPCFIASRRLLPRALESVGILGPSRSIEHRDRVKVVPPPPHFAALDRDDGDKVVVVGTNPSGRIG